MTSIIGTEKGQVVWRMDPGTARDLAEFIREGCPASDSAQMDALALEDAADAITNDPGEEMDPTNVGFF